jgi:peptide-methionine (R)-S-oxide reductase
MSNDKENLSDFQNRILDKGATEGPFTGQYNDFFEEGHYECVRCGKKLFESTQKFESSCGWPSFSDVEKDAFDEHVDRSYFMKRVEVKCSGCGGHFGHVFEDGPAPKGLRYCINSEVLKFVPKTEDESNAN